MSNTDKRQQELLGVMKEISHEMELIEKSRDQIKEIINAAAPVFELEKPILRKVAKFYHNRKISEFENEVEEIKNLYSEIVIAPSN